MNPKRIFIASTLGLGTLLASGTAFAACNANSSQTLAASTFEQSGQGNLSCADFTGTPSAVNPSGIMSDLFSPQVEVTVSGATASWSIPGQDADADVVIVEAADGKRCLYFYPGDSDFAGDFLQPGGNKNVKNVRVCSDSAPALAAPAEPVATSVDGCVGPEGAAAGIQDGVDGNTHFQNAIAFGNDPSGKPTAAVCSNNAVSAGTDQIRCVNQCIRPAGYPDHIDSEVDCTPDVDGQIPLECRACELSSVVPPAQPNVPADAPYCWELSHAVCEANDPSPRANCIGRIADTYIKPSPTEPGWARWERYEGSSCYLISVNFGGIQYDYWTPESCPSP